MPVRVKAAGSGGDTAWGGARHARARAREAPCGRARAWCSACVGVCVAGGGVGAGGGMRHATCDTGNDAMLRTAHKLCGTTDTELQCKGCAEESGEAQATEESVRRGECRAFVFLRGADNSVARGAHHAVEEVRTACTPSPAMDRPQWVLPSCMMRSASASEMKSSNETSHGSRE
eukprot:scaffold15474_cov101-Isochrysis_galbana.AAC.1